MIQPADQPPDNHGDEHGQLDEVHDTHSALTPVG